MMLPTVTQVLGTYADFSKVRPDVLKYASDRGRRIHTYIAAMLQDLFVPAIDEDCQPYVESFRLWANRHIEEVVWVEQELIDQTYGYRGHPDGLIRMVGDQFYAVPDWKSPVTQMRTWPLQTAGYGNLVDVNYYDKYPVRRIGALQLSPRGLIAKFRDYSPKYEYYLGLFFNALALHKYLKGR